MTEARITLPAGWLPPDMTPRDHQRAVVAVWRYNDPAKGIGYAVGYYLNGQWFHDETGDDLYPPLGYLPFEAVEVDTTPRPPWAR